MFYIYKKEGIKRLRSREQRLGVTDDADSKDEWHCLVELIDSTDNLSYWVRRVIDIPNWFLEQVCAEVKRLSITDDEFQEVVSFLKKRRDGMSKLILDHKSRFPRIKSWPLNL